MELTTCKLLQLQKQMAVFLKTSYICLTKSTCSHVISIQVEKLKVLDVEGNYYIGIVCFVIIGLKAIEPYIIRAVRAVNLINTSLAKR